MTCNHKRMGIVTNQPNGYDASLPHAAQSVCDRPECIGAAVKWVGEQTRMAATYIRDADRARSQPQLDFAQ